MAREREEVTEVAAGAERAGEARVAELEAALRARDELLATSSHELRTPITSLQLLLDSLLRARDRGLGVAEEAVRLRRANVQVRRIAQLVDDLGDVARGRERAPTLRVAEADLSAIARGVAERMSDALSRAGCALAVELPATVVGRWDELRLEQLVTHLLANAAQHAPGARVELSVRTSSAGPILSVRDHGPGIPLAERARVFERFVRLGITSDRQGMGVGLWQVRRIVAAHRGRVEIQDAPGGGATFVVSLPWDAAVRRVAAAAAG